MHKVKASWIKMRNKFFCFFKPVVSPDSRLHYYCLANRLQVVLVLLVYRNLLLVVQRIVVHDDQILTLLGNVVNVDNRLGIANTDYMIFQVPHYHLHPHYKVLFDKFEEKKSKIMIILWIHIKFIYAIFQFGIFFCFLFSLIENELKRQKNKKGINLFTVTKMVFLFHTYDVSDSRRHFRANRSCEHFHCTTNHQYIIAQ